MRYVFRTLAMVMALGLVAHLSVAQKSVDEVAEDSNLSETEVRERLESEGGRETHQGPDHPNQGNRGPDPYGAEGYDAIMEKAERQLSDPQWQLKMDMQSPRRIVVNQSDGTSKEYWYVMFRVINDNVREVRRTRPGEMNTDDVSLANPPEPVSTAGGLTGDYEGVPVETHLDFEFHVFTHDIEKNPHSEADGEDALELEAPETSELSETALEQRMDSIKKVYRPVSDQYVLQKIAEKEGMYEWMGNYSQINESIALLHPLSDFQRQIGFSRELSAPDLTGPRCLPYRVVTFVDGEQSEAVRYVAVHDDDTFAGIYGPGDELPDGARLVDDEDDPMWGSLTQRRYQAGDCVDRFGRPLRANDPGYLNARTAGGRDPGTGNHGVLGPDHPMVDQPVRIPHVRLYEEGDRVLFDYDTGIKHSEHPNRNHIINGRIVSPSDERYSDAEEISSATERFGGPVTGRPVKMIDHRGRAVRRYLVTYQAGDVLSQSEWDIYRRRLGEKILSRYDGIDDIVGRPLRASDPIVGMPKIKMGTFIGDAEDAEPEVIERGIDTGRRGPEGEVILDLEEYTTGRRYDPRNIGPDHFMRDPDGEFTTNREAPVPGDANLRDGEAYVYAPLGNARGNAVPVPRFDRFGAQMDYTDELSGSAIPLLDDEGELVRDGQDQILHLKEYEYEYVYMYEYDMQPVEDEGFRGAFSGIDYRMTRTQSEFVRTTHTETRYTGGEFVEEEVEVEVPLTRRILRDRTVTVPEVVDGFQVEQDGQTRTVDAEEYQEITGIDPATPTEDMTAEQRRVFERTVKVKVIRQREETRAEVVGVYHEDRDLEEGDRAETWEEARQRVRDAGGEIVERETIEYVDEFRRRGMAGDDRQERPREEHFRGAEETGDQDNGINLDKTYKTWSRWTVPPPLVYRNSMGEWEVVTRFADKVGPGTRWDDADADRFLTRYISEMWGVAIFEDVDRNWDFANVYVHGLRGHVTNSGLKEDPDWTSLPDPVGDGQTDKAFFNTRFVTEDWIYRARYERLGDGFENYRDLIRRVRTFWYRESDEEVAFD